MYISKVKLREKVLHTSLPGKFIDTNGSHKILWELFGDHPDRRRDFIFRKNQESRIPEYIVVSKRKPDNRKEHWNIITKEYSPVIKRGDIFEFMLRLNPTVKRKGRRHDIVMDALSNQKEKGENRPTRIEIAEEEGKNWLKKRESKIGIEFLSDTIRVDSYQQYQFRKTEKNQYVKISSIDFSGLLKVVEPESLITLLYHGIGPGKGYGFGLMLIKPVK